MKNVILIGMPAVGKTTVGRCIASQLNMEFLDTDDVIREKCMTTLPDLIEKHGHENFKKIEERIILDCAQLGVVIATGGSAVYGQKAMQHLKQNGIVLYLKISYNEIVKRLKRAKGRGVVIKAGQTLLDLYKERVVLYEKYADILVEVDGITMEETVKKCLEQLKKML